MELYVFDRNLNRIGIVDDYVSLKVERNYRKQSTLELTVGADEELVRLLRKENILVKSNEMNLGYIIETFEYTDVDGSEIYVQANSLSSILNRRIILGQKEIYGTADFVMKEFVRDNAVEPRNANRKIPSLGISGTLGMGSETTIGAANENLSELLFDVGNSYDLTHDIKLDLRAKTMTFDVWQGVDRTTEQNQRPYVIFSREFENVLSQSYVDSNSNYRSTAITSGEDAINRASITIHNEIEGLDRFEVFIDANNIKKTYTNEDGEEVTLNTIQYLELLASYGSGKLSSMKSIQTLESSVDPNSQFVYGIDYFLGDKVSVRNAELNVVLHTRIVSVVEQYDSAGFNLAIDFGENVPSIIEKIKRSGF